MADYRRLRAWQHARVLASELYAETAKWPPHERFGMISQVRRAVLSIGANLAEGCGRGRPGEIAHAARISLGSVNEVEFYCQSALDQKYWPTERAEVVLAELSTIRQMLTGLIRWAEKRRYGERSTGDR